MTKQEQNQHFMQYEKLINKQAHFYANKYQLAFDDVQGKALEIYCEAVNSYQAGKSSFSTYLYSELRRLNYYCKIENTMRVQNMPLIEDHVPEYSEKSDHYDFILQESIETELSNIAGKIVHAVLEGRLLPDPEKPRTQIFTISRMMDQFKLDYYTATNILHEVKTWWNRFEMTV